MNADGLRKLLANPFVGFAPWIAMAVLAGPDRLVLAAAVALGLALLSLGLGLAVHMSPKILDVAGIAFFGVLVVISIVASDATREWLEFYAGDLSNAVIFAIALLSIVIRQPFTIQYARESTPREYWHSPLFLHINYVLTWAWVAAFAVMAISGYIADGPLDDPDNLWLNWVVPIGALVLAIRFTDWYPDVAAGRAGAPGEHRSMPTIRDLLLPLSGFLVPVGIVVLIVGGTPWWLGVGLIVVGSLVSKALHDGAQTAQ